MNRGLISALSISAAAALFAGCGGQVANSVPQGVAAQATVHRESGSSGDLIYATGGCGGICVLSYPQGDLISSIKVTTGTGAPCSDGLGNVFVPGPKILEFQHGGTSPVATLDLPGSVVDADSCAVDPTTNNLAVTYLTNSGDFVAVFTNESGSPTLYTSGLVSQGCGYDNDGNLFVSGYTNSEHGLSELAYGQSTFTPLTVNGTLGIPGRVQWDGTYLTYENLASKQPERPSISRLTVSGSVATVVSTIPLNSKSNRTLFSWIYHGQVLVPFATRGIRINKIGIWKYPQGGKRGGVIKFKNAKSWVIWGVTVSVAPSR